MADIETGFSWIGVGAYLFLGLYYLWCVVRLWGEYGRWRDLLVPEFARDTGRLMALIQECHHGDVWLDPVGQGRVVVAGGRAAVRRALQEASTAHTVWRAGSTVTGVALVLTFVIIGGVMSGLDFRAIGGTDDSLTRAVGEMGSKFWVSALGVLGTLTYQSFAGRLADSLRIGVAEYVDAASSLILDQAQWERERAHERSAAVLAALEGIAKKQSTGTEATEHAVYRLVAIETLARQHADAMRQAVAGLASAVEQRVGSLEHVQRANAQEATERYKQQQEQAKQQEAWGERTINALVAVAQHTKLVEQRAKETSARIESIDAALQGGLTPLVSEVEKMAQTLLGSRVDEFITRLQGVLSTEMESVRSVFRGPEFRSAVSGGAADAAHSVGQTLEHLSEALPDILDQVRRASVDAQEANEKAFAAVASEAARSEARLGELQAVVEASVGNVRAVVDALVAHAREVLHGVAAQTEGAVQQMTAQTADATAGAFARLETLVRKLEEVEQSTSRKVVEERGRAATEQKEWNEALSTFNRELAVAVGSLRGEREAVETLASDIAARAGLLEQQRRVGNEAVERAMSVGAVAERVLKELRQQIESDNKVYGETRLQIAEIRANREELEAALHRIASAVADVLERDLRLINEQMERNAKQVSVMADQVADKLVLPLGESVQELREAVEQLGKVTPSVRAGASEGRR